MWYLINIMFYNLIGDSLQNFHEDYGFVEYSDPVSVYGYKMRLLVLTKGLICVRTQCSTSVCLIRKFAIYGQPANHIYMFAF